MKIGRKLMISNILITVIAMGILSIVISNIISDYIEDDIKKDLIKENKAIVNLLSYNKFLEYNNSKISVNLDYFDKTKDLPVLIAVFNMNAKSKLISTSSYFVKEKVSDKELENMYNKDTGQVYEIKIWNKSFLAYNELVQVSLDGNDYTLLATTLISNGNVNKIVNKIVYVLIIAIAGISILIVLISRYSERMITRPINVLVKITEKIALKHFEEKADLHTGDEFEILAVAINNMAESLKKQDIEQKRFYENISHEIKTPLTVISGYAQGVKTNIIEDTDKALDIITNECDRLKRQLENVIYLSKLDTIKDYFKLEKVSINEIISNALNKLYSIIIINDIDIIFDPVEDFQLYVDEEKVTRAFINILSNCTKYTKDTIYINVDNLEGGVIVRIADNGKGFSEFLLENPFSRTMIGEKEGSGIGLSIIRKVVDGHNGKITLANKKKGGAIYTIEFPL